MSYDSCIATAKEERRVQKKKILHSTISNKIDKHCYQQNAENVKKKKKTEAGIKANKT